MNSKRGMDNLSEQIGRKTNLGNRAENEGMVDIGGGMNSGDFGLPSSMGGTDTSGTLGGVPEANADMNMGTSNASSNAESGGEENGGMPNIDFEK